MTRTPTRVKHPEAYAATVARHAPRGVTLVVYTDGRGEYLMRTMRSLTERVAYQFEHALMIDDSGIEQYASWLDRTFPSFRHIHHAQRIGFAGAIRSAWSRVPTCKFLFSLEDDFTFNRDIDIAQMMCILDANSDLAQVVLKRQAWNDAEQAAGGIVELHPDWYEERETCGTWVSVHNAFFSTNPNLMRYELTRLWRGEHGGEPTWPLREHSEGHYGAWLREQGYKFAFLGRKGDAPRVEHIGVKRAGIGY